MSPNGTPPRAPSPCSRRGAAGSPGALRARSHRDRRAGQARPGHRPRRRDPPRDPGPQPAHQEQPGPDRRARRGQDGDRRGPGPADRRRRRAGVAARPPRDRPRHRRADRGGRLPGRVRGTAEGRPEGSRRRPGDDHPVPRRAPHDRRSGRRPGRRGRRQPAQADAGPRRTAGGRSHHPRRVPPAHREGRRPRAALPARVRGRAHRPGHDRDPEGAQGTLRGAPQSHDPGQRPDRGRHALPPLHRRPLPARQGDRPDRRGRLQDPHRDRLPADRDRRGRPPHHAARDRAHLPAQGQERRRQGAP